MSTNSFNENSKPHIFYRKINEFSARMMKKHANRLIFPILGLSSTIWFLMRVIPKPSRATYPCMKVAAPLASGFVAYIIGLATSIFAFRKARAYIREARYIIAGIFIVMALLAGIWGVTHTDEPAYATYPVVQHVANNPMGEGQGINPGRVVWVHDPDATNENFKASSDNAWFLDKNNDMDVIDKMVSRSVRELTGESTDKQRQDAISTFQEDPDTHVFLAAVKAGGESINLTEASYVIHFDHWWNPAVMWQAEDRAHRRGQRAWPDDFLPRP